MNTRGIILDEAEAKRRAGMEEVMRNLGIPLDAEIIEEVTLPLSGPDGRAIVSKDVVLNYDHMPLVTLR